MLLLSLLLLILCFIVVEGGARIRPIIAQPHLVSTKKKNNMKQPVLMLASTTSTKKSNPLRRRLVTYFEEKGFQASDIAKAIVCHEILGLTLLAITWSSCYFFPPSQAVWLQKPIASLAERLPKSWTTSLKTNKVLSSKLGSAYLESSCCRKVIRPLTIPGKLIFTFHMVKKLGEFQATAENSSI